MDLSIQRSSFEHFLAARSASDPEFRQQLIENPRRVVEGVLGAKLPDDLDVAVLEESAKKIFIRLPRNMQDGDELSDNDLEMVAGGKLKSRDTLVCTGGSMGPVSTKIEFHMT